VNAAEPAAEAMEEGQSEHDNLAAIFSAAVYLHIGNPAAVVASKVCRILRVPLEIG